MGFLPAWVQVGSSEPMSIGFGSMLKNGNSPERRGVLGACGAEPILPKGFAARAGPTAFSKDELLHRRDGRLA